MLYTRLVPRIFGFGLSLHALACVRFRIRVAHVCGLCVGNAGASKAGIYVSNLDCADLASAGGDSLDVDSADLDRAVFYISTLTYANLYLDKDLYSRFRKKVRSVIAQVSAIR